MAFHRQFGDVAGPRPLSVHIEPIDVPKIEVRYSGSCGCKTCLKLITKNLSEVVVGLRTGKDRSRAEG
jgi:hypothetical protein